MSDVRQERDEIADRLREHLYLAVRRSGTTQRALEQANGFTRGYLSQVLKGHVTLTARHVLGILLALEIPPNEFFQRFFDPGWPGRPEPLSEIRERMARYDAALDQLERKGLLDADSDPPEDPSSES